MARDRQVNVLLAAETVESLREEAERAGVSLSEVVRGRIEGYPSAVADAADWRRAALARCTDAERCSALEDECAALRDECGRLRAEVERLRGAQARRAPIRGDRPDRDGKGPQTAPGRPSWAAEGDGAGSGAPAGGAEAMAAFRQRYGRR